MERFKLRNLIMLGVLAAAVLPGQNVQTRRATMTGSRGSSGKCTIEVRVDGAAEVSISGDSGRLRTLSGAPASWVRMECSDPLPPNPGDFRFRGIDGRGRQELVADPRGNRGLAVVRIEDTQGGAEGYTFDIEWNGSQGGSYPGYGNPGYGNQGYGNQGYAPQRALDACRSEVQARASRDYGMRNIEITNMGADNSQGRRDWVTGTFDDRRGGGRNAFRFNCSVDFDSGRVRSVEITPAGGSGGYAGDVGHAIRSCQDAVVARLSRDGYRNPNFLNAAPDDRRGGGWIAGRVSATRGPVADRFDFACSVDPRGGQVRSVDLNRH